MGEPDLLHHGEAAAARPDWAAAARRAGGEAIVCLFSAFEFELVWALRFWCAPCAMSARILPACVRAGRLTIYCTVGPVFCELEVSVPDVLTCLRASLITFITLQVNYLVMELVETYRQSSSLSLGVAFLVGLFTSAFSQVGRDCCCCCCCCCCPAGCLSVCFLPRLVVAV